MGLELSAANVDERDLVPELAVVLEGILLGDKGYLSPSLTRDLAQQGKRVIDPDT